MNTISNYSLKEKYVTLAKEYPNLNLGRVIAQFKGLYKVATYEGEVLINISGKLRHLAENSTQLPAVGDYVMISQNNEVINIILERESIFERTNVSDKNQSQIVATNVDIVFICMSLNNNFNLSRLERYLSIAYNSGATPVILITKADLCENVESNVLEVEKIAPFTDIIVTTAFDKETCNKVLNFVKKGVTASFIGSSGVGKSTLINILMGEEIMATSHIDKADKGRHTTTTREMLILPNGGVVIDTPGMRELGVESANLSMAFSDIDQLSLQCRFKDCTHKNEPNCAVLEAIEKGELDQRRLENYFKIQKEVKYQDLNSREIENVKLNEMFKEFGGLKNARNFIKSKSKKR
ncbi:MAG: ribosome small subunit-dependent GTPase A [Anaerotignaceae bacterium]